MIEHKLHDSDVSNLQSMNGGQPPSDHLLAAAWKRRQAWSFIGNGPMPVPTQIEAFVEGKAAEEAAKNQGRVKQLVEQAMTPPSQTRPDAGVKVAEEKPKPEKRQGQVRKITTPKAEPVAAG